MTKKYVFVLLLSGCEVFLWQPVPPQVSQTAEANDGSQIAIVMQNYEQNQTAQNNPGHILAASKNFEHQIFVQNHDGSQRRAVTAKRPHQDEPGTFYFAKTAGYLVLGSRVWHNKNYVTRYDKINLATGQATLIRYQTSPPQLCQQAASQAFIVEGLIPSPTGNWLVHFYSPSCFKARVEFLDAHQLTPVDTQTVQIDGIYEAKWQGENLLLYPITDPQTAWELQPRRVPKRVKHQT